MGNGTLHKWPGLILLLLTLSCEKMTTWDIQPSERFPVVDCIITNELKYQELRLYMSSTGLNQQPEGISGAVITLGDGLTTYSFAEVEAGKYLSTVPFRASAGNVPTNFSHGIRGWFAACMVLSDTTVFE
jgi:hypothetical protein